MSARSTLAAACIVAVFFSGTALSAQTRFVVLGQSAIAEVSGLRIVTVRDRQLSMCHLLFIMEPSAPLDTMPVPMPADDVTAQSVQRIRDAAEARDRQLVELRARASKAAPWDSVAAARYEAERQKIEDAYEQVLRAEIPGSYPWATPVPGVRAGGWEDAANAMRRAVVDPDPTSAMKTATVQFARLDALLRRLIEAPRLAASGPFTCDAEATKPAP